MSDQNENEQKAGAECAQRLGSLCEVIKEWWEDHKYDTCGDYGDCNVYDDEPKFVTAAKEVIGDWESEANSKLSNPESP